VVLVLTHSTVVLASTQLLVALALTRSLVVQVQIHSFTQLTPQAQLYLALLRKTLSLTSQVVLISFRSLKLTLRLSETSRMLVKHRLLPLLTHEEISHTLLLVKKLCM